MKDNIFTPLQVEALAQTFEEIMREVDRRIAAQPTVHHAGTWKEGAFKGGALVTDKGSLWLAKRATTGRPGQSDASCANGHAEPHKHIATGVRR